MYILFKYFLDEFDDNLGLDWNVYVFLFKWFKKIGKDIVLIFFEIVCIVFNI